MPTLLTVDNCINHSSISHQIHCLMHSPHTVTISQMPFIMCHTYPGDQSDLLYQSSRQVYQNISELAATLRWFTAGGAIRIAV